MDFKYYILPGRFGTQKAGILLHNKVYLTWANFWYEVLSQTPEKPKLNIEEFNRQNFIVTIVDNKDQIAAIHLYSIFNVDSIAAMNAPYFTNNYNTDFVPSIKRLGVKSVMSMEYLTVLPQYRQKNIGWSMATALVGLGHNLQKELNLDATVAPCRCDLKVNQVAEIFGAKPLTSAGLYNGIETINMVNQTKNLTPAPGQMGKIINDLWQNRVSYLEPKTFMYNNEFQITG